MEEKKEYCIYKHTNKINGKVYIGQTCKKPNRRWHNGTAYKSCTYFYHAIQKYGWDGFEHEVLVTGLTLEEANEMEERLIFQYQSNNSQFGYNLQSGGKNKRQNESTKQIMQLKMSGEGNPMYGKHHSQENRQKMSENHYDVNGKNNPRWGKHCSQETKDKISEANSGMNNYGYGIPQTDERRKKTSRAVKCIETNIIYFGAREAEKQTGINHSGIVLCCQGKKNIAGGYHWEYVNRD